TFYYQEGAAGACGKIHHDGEHIVALDSHAYEGGAHCGKTILITDMRTGKTVPGVIADMCPGCDGPGSIDLS
ncbi:hypothetical protein M422DRAFT_111719, partial [Sphaerobolus stellatus SS14]